MSSGNVTVSNELLSNLEADQRRLEWLVMQDENIQRSDYTLGWYMEGYGTDHFDDWREAIDAAMKESGDDNL